MLLKGYDIAARNIVQRLLDIRFSSSHVVCFLGGAFGNPFVGSERVRGRNHNHGHAGGPMAPSRYDVPRVRDLFARA